MSAEFRYVCLPGRLFPALGPLRADLVPGEVSAETWSETWSTVHLKPNPAPGSRVAATETRFKEQIWC